MHRTYHLAVMRRSRIALLTVVLFLATAASGCSSSHHAARSSTPPFPSASPSSESPTSRTAEPATCPTPHPGYTFEHLTALRPAVDAMVGRNGGVGTGAHAIVVYLQPGREALAAALTARFRNAVQIQVGNAPYRCGPGHSRKCPDLSGSDRLPPGLHLSLKLSASSMRVTDEFDAHLVVREDSATPLRMDPGQPLVAMIVEPGTHRVVGRYDGLIGGTGLGLNLHDGQQATIRTIVAPWRCDGGVGSTVPPGRYGIRVGIGPNEGPAAYLAPEVPLTITA
jgi:hypothetical protein